MKTSAILTDS